MTQKWEYVTLSAAYAGQDFYGLGIVKMYNGEVVANWKARNWGVKFALQELGDQGYELVTVLGRGAHSTSATDPVYYFKRPKS